MNELSAIIAENLKTLRHKHRLTQAQMAERIGVAFRSYQNYEGEKRIPKSNVISTICKEFGVEQAELFMRNGGPVSKVGLSASELTEIMNNISSLGPGELEILRDTLDSLTKPIVKKQAKNERQG